MAPQDGEEEKELAQPRLSFLKIPSGRKPGFLPGSGSVRDFAVKVPDLSAPAREGESAFNRYCVECHGASAAGSDKGPSLVHRIYNPNHHSDQAFVLAARRGSRAHHWRVGDMKPVPKVTDQELIAIIRYVRELQRANGIF